MKTFSFHYLSLQEYCNLRVLSLYTHYNFLHLNVAKKPSHGEKSPYKEKNVAKKVPTWRESSKTVPYTADFFPCGESPYFCPPPPPPPRGSAHE